MAGERLGFLAALGPGLLVAATGVGAGDLATAAFAGNHLGVAVLWAVLLGAAMKFALTEGLARWQLATGTGILEGIAARLGRPFVYALLAYLFAWSYFVGAALIGACGVAAHALLPLFPDPGAGKIAFGILHSLAAAALVLAGGFRAFEKVMNACIVLMFVSVLLTAALLAPDIPGVLSGLFLPRIPRMQDGGLAWTIALIGGVGGTLTILCYGYWIREKGREGPGALGLCRLDLGVAYACTAFFGLAAVVIGSRVAVEGQGAGLIVAMAGQLELHLGPAGRWIFLAGAWAALFSSLLGVWQSAPYLFADLWRLRLRPTEALVKKAEMHGRPYRLYLLLLAIVPLAGLAMPFQQALKVYSLAGALFLPLLAMALLVLNGRGEWVGKKLRNGPVAAAGLVAVVLFFLGAFFLSVEVG